MTDQEKRERKEREEDRYMEKNIESIGEDGDVSQRQINQLRGKNKKKEKRFKHNHKSIQEARRGQHLQVINN